MNGTIAIPPATHRLAKKGRDEWLFGEWHARAKRKRLEYPSIWSYVWHVWADKLLQTGGGLHMYMTNNNYSNSNTHLDNNRFLRICELSHIAVCICIVPCFTNTSATFLLLLQRGTGFCLKNFGWDAHIIFSCIDLVIVFGMSIKFEEKKSPIRTTWTLEK